MQKGFRVFKKVREDVGVNVKKGGGALAEKEGWRHRWVAGVKMGAEVGWEGIIERERKSTGLNLKTHKKECG